MNSWHILLMVQMRKGEYLDFSPLRSPDDGHWLRLWVLMMGVYPDSVVT